MDVKNKKKSIWKIMIRCILFALFTILLIWYLLPIAANILNIGNASGAVACICGMLITGFYEKFKVLLKHLSSAAPGAILLRGAGVLVLLGLVYTVCTVVMINAYSHRTPDKSSTVVVLGCKVNDTRPSLMLHRRISAAYKYLCENNDAVCVLSGGKGDNEGISEAQCMYNELVERGIDASRLYIEDKSTSTYENLKFSYDVIESNGLNKNIAVVTDGFHQLRANMIAKKLGIDVTGAIPAKTPGYLFLTYLTREIVAVLAQILGLSA